MKNDGLKQALFSSAHNSQRAGLVAQPCADTVNQIWISTPNNARLLLNIPWGERLRYGSEARISVAIAALSLSGEMSLRQYMRRFLEEFKPLSSPRDDCVLSGDLIFIFQATIRTSGPHAFRRE